MTLLIGFLITIIALLMIRGKELNLKNWTFIIIILHYALLYYMVITWSFEGYSHPDSMVFIKDFDRADVNLMYLLACVVMMIGFYVSYYVLPLPKHGIINYKRSVFLQDNNRFWKQLTSFSIITLILSFVAYYVYSLAYGGFGGLLAYTMIIRRGAMDVANSWSFLQVFGTYSYISAFCLFSIMLNKKILSRTRRRATIGWVFAFAFSGYVAISQGGRGMILNLLLIYILTLVFAKTNSFVTIVVRYWPFLLLAVVGFVLSSILWRGEIEGIKPFVTNGYAYLFSSFSASLKNDNYLFFVEVLLWPLYFLPQSLYMGKGFVTTNMHNTSLMQGGYKGEMINGMTISGENTTGFLSFSYYQFGLIGVFFLSIIIGMCIRKWNCRINIMPHTPFRNMLYAYYVIQVVYYFIGSGTMYNFIIGNFAYFTFFLVFPLYRKIF